MTRPRHAALRLASRGVPTFPCVPDGKRPVTPRGFLDASTDRATIARWFDRWPRANLAVPTGLRSGFVVLDVDTKRTDGFATLARLEREFEPLPPTLTVRTPSGGEHRWFRAPGAVVRSAAGRIAGAETPGLDVRGDGGYVLVPPSSIDGRAYAWTDRRPAAELPAGWLAALRSTERAPERPRSPARADRRRARGWCLRALRDEARALAETAAGTRNDRLWRAAAALAGLVGDGLLEVSEVRRALVWACSTWTTRDEDKDLATMERGIAFGLAHPRVVDLLDEARP